VTVRLPADQRRRQLLDTACEVFAAHGYHGTAMDDIATRAGVTKPVLYQHFRSKRALFVEVLEEVGSLLLVELAESTRPATAGREQVEAGFTAYFRFVANHANAFRLLFGASVRNDPEFAAVVDGILTHVVTVVSEYLTIEGSEEHRRALAHGVIGIAEAASREALRDESTEIDPERLGRWLSDLAWFGLRGVRADPARTTNG
jgi:AcrR family transcriptional regulator